MKYAFIQIHRRVWPISVQCRVLEVSVAGYHEHETLAPCAEVDHRGDGYSEWFQPVAHPMAVRLLSQVPLDERSDRRARLTAIRVKARLAPARN